MRDNIYGSMIDAMLLDGTTPEQIAEIGRMAEEGAAPPLPDEDSVPPLQHAAESVASFLRTKAIESVRQKLSAPEPTELEQNPEPVPNPAPIRHARKKSTLPVMAPPLTASELRDAGKPQPIIINMPPAQESPAMMKVAEGIAEAMKNFSKAASTPQAPAKVVMEKGAIQVSTPVTIDKGAVNVEAPKPANVKVDVHVPKPARVKELKRDKDGNLVKPIYEDE